MGEFSSQKNMDYYYFSPNTTSKISLPPTSIQHQKHYFLQHQINMNMNLGFYYKEVNNNNNNNNIIIIPSSSSSSSSTTATANNLAETYLLPSMAAVTQPPFAALLQKHNHQLDLFLHFQGERLKEAIHQQKREQLLLIANTYESKAMSLLKEKEENLEKLRLQTTLLEEYLKKAETESELWQNIAIKKEEMVIELNNMLLFAQQNNIINNNNNNNNNCYYYSNDKNDDNNDNAESVCDGGGGGGGVSKMMGCKLCKNGSMNVVLLPCKHLCCCKDCESLLELCPVCQSVKHGSLEVFFP